MQRFRGRERARSTAKLSLVLPMLLLPGCGAPDSSMPTAASNVLLVTLDTTRADHLGCYGNRSASTPAIDALAAEGVRFDLALAPVPLTLPSHATLFTGQHPTRHGVRYNGLYQLPAAHDTWAERLQRQGYATAAFVACAVLESQFGLEQGFSHYDDRLNRLPGQGGAYMAERDAASVTSAAMQWLEDWRGQPERRPFFLWVHYFDPHFPHRPPAAIAARFANNLYDGEIAAVDAEFARLRDDLDRHGLADQTLIVLTADHGEGLGEKQERSHGHFLYQSTLRVPLILRHSSLQSSQVVAEPVALVDVLPTVLDLLGLPAAAEADGLSLMPLLQDSQGLEERALYFESELPRITFGFRPLAGVLQGRFKYIDAPEPELYDLSQDPREEHNLAAQQPDRVARLRRAVEELRQDQVSSTIDSSSETEQMLAALGYASGASDAEVHREQWRRQDLLEVIALRDLCRNQLIARRYLACVESASQLAAKAPGCYQGFELWGTALAKSGRYQEATVPLQAALALQKALPDAWWNLATCHHFLGDPQAARVAVEEVIKLQPQHQRARQMLAAEALQAGDHAAARKHLTVLSTLAPESSEALWARQQLRQLDKDGSP